jgi:hypothetical protein
MSVTPAPDLAGVLPVVISGGRPLLSQRCTTRLLPALKGVTADPVWMVREDRAPEYERDQFEVATFGRAEAEEYAARHWIGHEPFAPGAFLGGFTEREWACRLAEERGCWAVLQLDDNIQQLRPFSGLKGTQAVAMANGGLGFYADVLAAITLSTNSHMTGASLSSVNPSNQPRMFVRAGFPYSLFLERVGPRREEYFGPFEDDIMHACQYLARADDACSAVVAPLAYLKEHTTKTGMRSHYNNERSRGIQMVVPEMVGVSARKTHSNGRGEGRVFHRMGGGSIRTPLIVTDPELFGAARDYVTRIRDEQIVPAINEGIRERVEKRARQAGA